MSQHTPQASTTDPSVVTITFLLVSGKKTSLGFKSTDTIEDVKRHVFEDWPKDWVDEMPSSPQSLKILYLGKFLADDSTLESNKIPQGSTTIVHLTIKAPEPEHHGNVSQY
ncbi:Ubiquitin-like protein 3 [Actinomortierella ambigua]|uniref:Ubiquitin-like protein 3 n=1 Tax=Actinomortierella ambigua TaxID=1343610 RepID=A0A9P6QCN3_9FUNG|nr:Ubiquitin-like protein 3 [Actinomortierella ambigua]KAG0262697.1 Ubiquitin-like protein 3 [Actinomortierella ambigua]